MKQATKRKKHISYINALPYIWNPGKMVLICSAGIEIQMLENRLVDVVGKEREGQVERVALTYMRCCR